MFYDYIYIIYTPNLGLGIACFVREREQGRFRGSTEGAPREHKGASREQGGAVMSAAHWEPELAVSCRAIVAFVDDSWMCTNSPYRQYAI